MKIEDVIRNKGTAVVTIVPGATVAELVDLLVRNNIGAVVVSPDGAHIAGIVSERDIVRHLGTDGAAALGITVREIMTEDVRTCTLDDKLEDTAASMTTHRIRHMPVVEDGQLRAIVSIGDVVKHRLEQLTDEHQHLLGYLHS